jgi:CheY-like chemotaxis protein
MILPTASSQEARKIILIVEDEVLIRMVVADYLRDWGYHVLEAGSADEALEYLRRFDQIDLMFSDVRMPGSMEGLELAQQVRVLYPQLPVILASGHLCPAEAGDTPLLSKPYDLSEVAKKVHALLGEG